MPPLFEVPLFLLLVACATSLSSGVKTDTEPPGDNCDYGGVAIATGIDENGDGVLGDDEIDETSYVCNGPGGSGDSGGATVVDGEDGADGVDGEDGADGVDGEDGVSILVVTSAEAEGANCTYGGVRLDIGADDNGDGVLAVTEVDYISYVCNGEAGADGATGADGTDGTDGGDGNDGADGADGTDGADGADGLSAVVSTADEPAGANCTNGGVAISAGIDDNGDGVLDTSEVDTTSYVCNGEDGADGTGGVSIGTTIVGNYTVENSLDIALLSGVTEITGTLSILGDGLTDIEIPDLVTVGSIEIGENNGYIDNPVLATLSFPSLTTINGDLRSNYLTLNDWSGFDAVVTVAGDILLQDVRTTAPGGIGGFAGLLTVAGNLTVDFGSSESAYIDISGFNALEIVGGYVWLDGGTLTGVSGFNALTDAGALYFQSPLVMTSVTGFTSLTNLTDPDGYGLYLEGCSVLVDISGLSALRTIAGPLSLSSNTLLSDLTPLDGITSTGRVVVSDMPVLATLAGLAGLTDIGGLYLYNNDVLVNLRGLSGITSNTGDITISGHATLPTLEGLENIPSATDVTISSNSALPDLDGLSGLITVTDLLSVGSNPLLANVDALSNLASVGNLLVSNNAVLTDLDGFSGLTTLSTGGSLTISQNSLLADISGLGNLGTYAGSLTIENNAVLTNLDGLEGLTSLQAPGSYNYALGILNNTLLTDLDGLYNLTTVTGGYFTINGNRALCTTVANALRDDIGTSNITSVINVSGNKSGC